MIIKCMKFFYYLSQRSFKNTHEDPRQSKTIPVHGVQSWLQYGRRAHITHAKSQETGRTTAQWYIEL